MTWEETYKYLPQYEYVSTNQHGNRYRQIADKQISCAKLSADVSDVRDLRDLILLSHFLEIPVHYNFKSSPQTAYIEVMAKEAVE